MLRLQIIIASTRPNRGGLPVANWFIEQAKQHNQFELDIADLKEINLPHLDEPEHPRLKKYQHAHTIAWGERVNKADAFVFVTPEYNYGSPPALINGLNYLFQEWAYKPVGFVSYGGMSGGLRSVQMTKQIVTTLKMMPLPDGVVFPMYAQSLNKETGVFSPDQKAEKAAQAMLNELVRWTNAMKVLRT